MTKQTDPEPAGENSLLPSWLPGPIALLTWAFLALALIKPLLPLSDQATGRHLTSGKIILEGRQLPTHDQLGYLYGDREYLDFEWLFDLTSRLVHDSLGLDFLVLLTFILFALTLGILLHHLLINGISLPVALLGVVLLSVANYVHLLTRPIIFTYFFLSLVVWKWTQILRQKNLKSGWWLPLVFLFWANIHPGFTSGLLFMGLSLVGALWDERKNGWIPFQFAGLLLALCALATLINPYGWNLHLLIIHQVFHSKSLNQVQEFLPPDFFHPNGAVIALTVVLGSILIWGIRQKEKIALRDVLPALIFLYFAVKVQRHILLLLPVVLLPMCRLWDLWLLSLLPRCWLQRRDHYTALALHAKREVYWVAAGLLAIGTFFHLAFRSELRIGGTSFTPRAEQFIRDNALLFRRPFTSTIQAGNLLFYFHPQLKVSFDDRVDFYQDSDSFAHLSAINAEGNWRDFLGKHAFDSALLYPTDPLAESLSREPGWTKIYSDSGMVIFQKEKNQNGSASLRE